MAPPILFCFPLLFHLRSVLTARAKASAAIRRLRASLDKTREQTGTPYHFLFIHGAYHGGWCFDALVEQLREEGHGREAVALEGTAVDAVSSFEENLMGYPDAYRALTFDKMVDRTVEKVASLPDDAKVVLVGHSWGCMPMTMAAEKCPPERLAFIVYLSGPCPSDGQSAFDLGNEWFATPASEGGGAELITEVMDKGKFWEDHYPEDDLRSPSGLRVKRSPSDKTDEKLQFVRRVGQAEFYCDLSEMERVRKALYGCCPERVSAEMLARMRPMPLANFSVRVALTERFESIPRAYVKCLRDESMHPAYQEFIVKRRGFREGSNAVYELDTDHSPQVSHTKQLAALLADLAEGWEREGKLQK
ncbi:unnamed protein product [Vitrella brassicaformis CCMP3155]|uniref:AB hydrolase-1 domain-containing protein n=2 Tax=Vitrella brassicaformis TaxID=1169539 RepID=A0A0G4EQI5_VITBC|nr:unnamed protein product [Vitrella brassicaformis CCMP3155]|mmetsp:Transcript_30361/g.88242  ORF Transcript_30361/g.88242 Transcript_30361/m.88242 type:complete len:362 (+) Transcript_30361:87-1172(+)|eukprot:CEL99493.1 unnamed protein product [Vitrella brassicaformis CCMP3155]